jgi:hypothetical protein
MKEHWAWWLLTMACIAWYSSVTVYVSVKGAFDIKHMLRRLSGDTGIGETGDKAPSSPKS